jgi:two-component system NarL family sensor kinase
MHHPLKYILSTVLFLLVLCGCKEPSGPVIYRQAEQGVQTERTVAWLAEKDHFHADNYYTVFEAYYQQQLHNKNYAAAAAALEAVAEQEMYYLFFKEQTLATVQSFRKLYRGRLSWDQTLFIESYTGNYYLTQSEYPRAIAHFEKNTRHVPFDYHTCCEIAHAHGDIAFCYSATGEQEKALQSNLKALSWFNRTDNLTGKGGIYDNIALVHLFTKNYRDAETYFDKAMNAYKAAGDTTNMFTTLHNKILLYQETDSPEQYPLIDSTYRFFVSSHIEDPSMEVALASFYLDKLLHENRTAEAKILLDRMALQTAALNSPSANADYQISLATYEMQSSGGIIDTDVIEKALEVVEAGEDFQNQIGFCDVLKENAALQGDYKKALFYSEKEKTALNALTNQEMIVKTMQLNKRHEMEKKEQHIAIQQKTILNKNIAIALLMAILATFCLVAAIIYFIQKQKEIRKEGKRVLRYTRQLLEKTEEERKRIAGDLHDSVSHQLLNLKNAVTGTDSEAGTQIDAIINDIRIISRNLHPIMFEKVGLAASIEQLVERAQAVHDLMVTADIDYDASLSTSDELQIYRIVQEALSNTIKYAAAFAAKITLLSRNGSLHIQIKDNGQGFNVAEKLSGPTAFGLHNILERSKVIGGFAKISSGEGGTVITIEIKKHP